MDKKIIFVLFVIGMLFLSGCDLLRRRTGPTDKTKGELVTPKEVSYHKGFKGLEMEFVKGQPGESAWEAKDFPITLKVHNKGAYPIQAGILTVTGNLYFITDRRDIGISFDLEGKSEFNPEGEFSYEKFFAKADTIDEDKIDTFTVVACYPYKTYGSATICINPRLLEFDEGPKGECEVGTITLTGGQGAPVAITSIEEEIAPIDEEQLKLSLNIHVSNKGGGKVIARNIYKSDCGGEPLLPEQIGKIEVSDIRFSNYRLDSLSYPIECPNLKDKSFKLDSSGRFTIECFANLDPDVIGSVAFTTPLLVELNYGYSQISDPKIIKIKKTLE